MQSVSGTAGLRGRRHELLLLFVEGFAASGFFFGGFLHAYLSPIKRPVVPDPALGFTHPFNAKHGHVYGTLFEYLAVTYGFWMMWIVAVASVLLFRTIEPKSRTYARYPREIFAAAAISIMLYYVIWRVTIYAARS